MTIFAKSSISDFLSSPLKQVTTGGKGSISDVWQGLELTFALIIFAKLLPICLLNLINSIPSHHISSNCSTVHGQIHVTLRSTYLLNNENYNSVS